jgi:hypothetical protein
MTPPSDGLVRHEFGPDTLAACREPSDDNDELH